MHNNLTSVRLLSLLSPALPAGKIAMLMYDVTRGEVYGVWSAQEKVRGAPLLLGELFDGWVVVGSVLKRTPCAGCEWA